MNSLIVAEPPSAYGERPRLVVDASVLAATLFEEDGHDVALSWMRGRMLCAPHLVDCEIANIALAKIQRKVTNVASAVEALQVYAALDIERHSVEPSAVFALAMRTGLTVGVLLIGILVGIAFGQSLRNNVRDIYKWCDNNVAFDFLPVQWLVHVNDLKATMTMAQPFPDVWLPDGLDVQLAMTVAIGEFDLRYSLDYHDYRRTDVTSKVGIKER